MGAWIEAIAGLGIIGIIWYDLFQSVVLPRPAVGKLRISAILVRWLWMVWRWLGLRRRPERRENFLAIFGPGGLLVMLLFWALCLVVGFALLLYALKDQIRPETASFADSLYFSAICLVTLGFGDIVPAGNLARVIVLIEAATGLGLVALVISLLFSLYGSFQRREEQVVTLDAMAGAPPSGVQMLETAAKNHMPAQLELTFNEWRLWSASVLESHLAYPILIYFRSSHDNEAWLNSFGAVMDAATLILSTVEDGSEGVARLLYKVGSHLVEDVGWYFGLVDAHEPGVERVEFEQARQRLAKVGYPVRDEEEAWRRFSQLRSGYASRLNQLALWLAIMPAEWIGDRSYIPHRRRSASPQRLRLGGRLRIGRS